MSSGQPPSDAAAASSARTEGGAEHATGRPPAESGPRPAGVNPSIKASARVAGQQAPAPTKGTVKATAKVLGNASAKKAPEPGSADAMVSRRFVAGFGRYGVWAIPIFALAAALAPRSSAAFSTDPTAYARYAATGRYEIRELIVVNALALLGVVSILAMGALLAQGRSRKLALAGLVAGCVGAAAMLWQIGTLTVRADRLRHDLLGGDFGRLAFNAQDKGGAAVLLALGGAAVLIVGWILYGIATIRTPSMNRSDGVLLIISAPMLFGGGMILNMIPVLGSFLLLAAGLGIGLSAGRVIRGEVFAPASSRNERRERRRRQGQGQYPYLEDFGLLPAVSRPVEPLIPTGQLRRRPRGGSLRVKKGWRSSTSWSVSRDSAGNPTQARSTAPSPAEPAMRGVARAGDAAAPPTPVPAGAKNLKPVVTRRKARNDIAADASMKNGVNLKSGNAPSASDRKGREGDRNSGPGGKG